MLFIIVSFHHQSEVIFYGTISGKQIFGCKVTFLLRKKLILFCLIYVFFVTKVIFFKK